MNTLKLSGKMLVIPIDEAKQQEALEDMKLGKLFVAQLKEWLSASEFELMLKLNAEEKNKDCCHSHDFCDANMAMLGAYCALKGVKEEDVDVCSEEVLSSINSAWDWARANLLEGQQQ